MAVQKKQSKKPEHLDASFVYSTSDTCVFFGITRETLSAWSKKGAPKESRGSWDIKKLNDWLGHGAGGNNEPISNEARKLKADADYRERKAEKEEISLAVLKGQYVSKEEVDRQWSVIGNQLKTNMLLWSRTMAPELAHLDMRSVEKVLTDAVYDLLEQLSSTSRYRKAKKTKKK